MNAWIEQALGSSELSLVALPAAFFLGILSALGSCCNVAAVGAIAGYSGAREDAGRRGMIVASLSFMLGTIVALVALGAAAGFVSQAAGNALGSYWKVFAGVAAILFGLVALNLVPFKLPKVGSPDRPARSGTAGAAVFGLVVGGAAAACSVSCNPVLAVALGVAVLQGRTLWGAVILGVFAFAYSLPLAAILLGLSFGKSALKAKKAAAAARIAGGVLLLGVGFYLLGTV
jgi:cytochrome c biogenesis protein CcdA